MDDNKDLEMTQQNEDEQDTAQDEKRFTQAEVDEIVKKRLARERQKADRVNTGTDVGNDRESALAARELKLMAKEKLLDAGMPLNLADVLNYSDEDSLKAAIETIKNLNPDAAKKGWGIRISEGKTSPRTDPIRKAWGLE